MERSPSYGNRQFGPGMPVKTSSLTCRTCLFPVISILTRYSPMDIDSGTPLRLEHARHNKSASAEERLLECSIQEIPSQTRDRRRSPPQVRMIEAHCMKATRPENDGGGGPVQQ